MNTSEKETMSLAKAHLLNVYAITEPQAHLFILKTAMELRETKIAIAQKIIELSACNDGV